MENKHKTMIYPFDVESVPLIRHNNLINNHNFLHIISPNGWGLNGKDAGDVDNGQPLGINVDNNFDKGLENCDTVFFNDSSMETDLEKFIYPKIIRAAENSKNIICTIKLKDEMIHKITHICNEKNTLFKYFIDPYDTIINPPAEQIYEINTPIIFVIGLGERTNKFEIQLNLRENLKEMGYTISQIGTRHYCELMGFHSFPRFMYNKSISESEKVTYFNHYVKNIEIKEQPDVIIIGIPGGTIPFNYEFTNRFGILAYEVSQAVKPDAVVLSTLYNKFPTDFFESISNSHKYKFGYNIDCYNVANASLNIPASKMTGALQYTTMDWTFVNEKKNMYSTLDTPVYNILDSNDAMSMSNFLVNKLADYADTQII